jgi:hypothetical protein
MFNLVAKIGTQALNTHVGRFEFAPATGVLVKPAPKDVTEEQAAYLTANAERFGLTPAKGSAPAPVEAPKAPPADPGPAPGDDDDQADDQAEAPAPAPKTPGKKK